ncbi:MAG: hypothetical protein UHS49_03305 [Faecalimonas sp.]|nr:hypothetical protein [Faecalimonas sp.]
MSVLIDIPQIAYKTMSIEYVIIGQDGKRDRFAELNAEQNLRESLKGYSYSLDHEHMR